MSRRLAKGRFGASILDGMLEIQIDLPIGVALDLDQDKVGRYAGNRAARTIRKRMRGGIDGDGGVAHQPERGRPFRGRTGGLLRSIRYDRKTGVVKPESRRGRGDKKAQRERKTARLRAEARAKGSSERKLRKISAKSRVRTNFAVMSVHIAEGRWRDPMGSENPSQWKQIAADVEVELQKQLNKGALTAKNRRRGGKNGRRAGRRR